MIPSPEQVSPSTEIVRSAGHRWAQGCVEQPMRVLPEPPPSPTKPWTRRQWVNHYTCKAGRGLGYAILAIPVVMAPTAAIMAAFDKAPPAAASPVAPPT